MTKPLKRLGFVHNKPKRIPAKADVAAQRRFVTETLLPLIRASSEECPLYFADATHPACTGRPAHGWIGKGQTRDLKSNHGRTRLDIHGALCWHDRSILHRQEEKITGAALAWLTLLIMQQGTICSRRLAAPGASQAQTDSVRRRFYRFFWHVKLDSAAAACVAADLPGLGGKPWVLTVDRTN